MSSPICVSDTFHFSHYYWNEESVLGDSESEEDSPELLRPHPVPADTIRLKFYSQVMGDGECQIVCMNVCVCVVCVFSR